MKRAKNILIIVLSICLFSYVIYLRFTNTELTETQLFLKLIGM